MDGPMSGLGTYHVPGSRNTYYIPDFVTPEEEEYLIRKVQFFHRLHLRQRPSAYIVSDKRIPPAQMEKTTKQTVGLVIKFEKSKPLKSQIACTGYRSGVRLACLLLTMIYMVSI